MATPARDVLVETLEEQRKHLESERDKFTEATLELGREKAALEVCGYLCGCVCDNHSFQYPIRLNVLSSWKKNGHSWSSPYWMIFPLPPRPQAG